MPSQMLLNVDYKLSHVQPLTDEESQWLINRLDSIYDELENAPTDEDSEVDLFKLHDEDQVRLKFTGMSPKER
jgi:hypothetical protein